MSFLTSTAVASGGHTGRKQAQETGSASHEKILRQRSSIGALVGLVKNPISTLGSVYESWYEKDAETKAAAHAKQVLESKKRLLYLKLQEATSYDGWRAAAEELDTLEANDAWKSEYESADYDCDLVAARLGQLEAARVSGDVAKILHLVRTALTRDLGNMGNVELYRHSHIGTKDLIERYIDVALETINTLLASSTAIPERGNPSHRYILEQVISARQAFGRSALLLSGGGTFGMAHNGVLKVLWEQKLLPRIISGASAGSIVCAIMSTRTDEEIPDLLEQFCHGDLDVFEEEGKEEGVMRKVARFLKHGHLYDISHLERVMKQSLGDLTFQEAYNRTRRILNICVSSASIYELPRLLNYVTAPNVLIWSAVAASCSVPLVFSPASLLAKDPRTGEHIPWNPSPQGWIDGSVENDLPMTRLAEMFNVNHFIVSQVNPHVIPFLERDEGLVNPVDDSSTSFTAAPGWLHTVTHMAKGEALYRLRSMAELGVFPNALSKAASILNQKYSGDITIMPAIEYQDFTRILTNPTEEFMLKAALIGERATWPKISRIRNHCSIELALDDAVQRLRTRVVFSSSQVDLRLDAYSQARAGTKQKLGKQRRDVSHQAKASTTRPTTRTKRSMSQHSEPDASLIMAARGSRAKGRPGSSASGNSGQSSHTVHVGSPERRSERAPGSTGSTGVLTSASGNSVRPSHVRSNTAVPRTGEGQRSDHISHQHVRSAQNPASAPSRAQKHPPVTNTTSFDAGLPDITSSGAETSVLGTSDDEMADDHSDASATSNGSPSNGQAQKLAAHELHAPNPNLFPHASQPATPTLVRGYRPFGLTLTAASPAKGDEPEPYARGPAGGTPGVGPHFTSNTASTGEPSTPERRYKQLFHGTGKRATSANKSGSTTPRCLVSPPPNTAVSSTGQPASTGAGQKKKRLNALGLEIPLPTRRRSTRDDGKNTRT